MIYTKKQNISASMLASDGNLSKVGSFQMIQDAVTELMGKLHIDGFTVKEKYNAFWVFTKTRAKFLRVVPWNDIIVINAFISHISSAKISIDVEIKNKNDEVVIYSRTELCGLGIDTQRIMRVSMLGVEPTMLETRELVDIVFTKFEEADLPSIDKVQIKYTNIDMSHHTNNLEYIRLVMNTYSVEEMESKSIKEMEIIYFSQSFEEDILDIRKAKHVDKDFIVIEKTGKPVVKCEIVY